MASDALLHASHAPVGLVLSGGGARAAYQVGVLRAIADLMPAQCHNPFPVICGTSAGGLNAAGLAVYAGNLRQGVAFLESIWSDIHTHQVYRTDWYGVMRTALRWLATMAFGGFRRHAPVSLLDNSPLRDFLAQHLRLERIHEAVRTNDLRALCITASGYTSGASVSFFQGNPDIAGWQRSRRIGIPTAITVDHLLASAAIPLLFPAVLVNREYFGDGALRQTAPISPALHLGAKKILVIGVSSFQSVTPPASEGPPPHPSIAQVVNHILDSSFIDGLEADIERLKRINRTISFIAPDILSRDVALRPVDVLTISPSAEVLDSIAMRHAAELPRSIRLFVRGSGATQRAGSGVLSYLLFEAAYCRELMQLGYRDGMHSREDLIRFFRAPSAHTPNEAVVPPSLPA